MGFPKKNDRTREVRDMRLNSIEITKLYDLIDTKNTLFDIIQEPSGIGTITKAISKLEDGDEEYDITDYDCW